MVPEALLEPPLVVICGPTAVGKTAAAVALAARLGAEIVAADSRTVYRYMDIGTAKPSVEQRRAVPHHLLDIADPDEVVTLARYRDLALEAIRQIRGRGRVPLLVGGTGLYIRAVVNGFAIPAVAPDWELRRRLEALEASAPGTLYTRLCRVDPAAAARIHPRNLRRVIRALEVYERTGAPISQLQRRGDPVGRVVQVGLTMDRAALYRRIDERADSQIAAGLVDEVRDLLRRGYAPTLPAMSGVGYKEIVAHLTGQVSLEEAVRRLKRNTRRLAKRQYTWFRADPRIRWIDVDQWSADEVARRIAAVLE
ncbi:MAG: tRNA (adenosine(37)-N6)-dimethylallyltransferase MiaA [Armatimonadota bacterium]|nr:tRNA (adenosine(37)-N6)-dimethylallyltransferase MiaA [Armatimonadota bacterium]MDR7450269.1 tRNA (adenosine(37)-N6)-dimethylallyltransferase MiaA [Armatimonadota bacterium]MDR7467148.1 tRNA (adenosine(37)-N6)-dimethylallyltransferase MiaA [Armatimonadota bacterium]MDR7493310.1 tRNA (adenosine(37)-N6)-dimethylallyltransferase MiaA [Armatimonadota bacterium]MDR7505442.1 tRNA (adenosine(37)-N6)-dimethylallyltransferase MiaA [Armatimonadota bacterium]